MSTIDDMVSLNKYKCSTIFSIQIMQICTIENYSIDFGMFNVKCIEYL